MIRFTRDILVTQALRLAVLGVLVLAGAAGINAAHANSPDGAMAAEQVRKAVIGRRIYIAVPFGGEIPLYYRPDGRVDGSGEAIGLGRALRPTDSGRWWLDGDRLCQKWTSWYDGQTFCFALARVAEPGRIAWFRDDGERGVARIGD